MQLLPSSLPMDNQPKPLSLQIQHNIPLQQITLQLLLMTLNTPHNNISLHTTNINCDLTNVSQHIS